MQEGRPSATAQGVAMRRAAHQLLDAPTVFDDPLALRIIGHERALALQADRHRLTATLRSAPLRAFVAVRSRYAEDELALAVQHGIRQYVILGAGLDTFAYRNPHPKGVLRIFEVDHPATQAWKRSRLAAAGIAQPCDLTFAPVDFEMQTLAAGLRDAGCDPDQGTFFSWLGVTEYLTPETVMATFRFIASTPTGSGVVFDYVISPSLLNPARRKRFDALARRVVAAGEPWQTFFNPVTLAENLRAIGFGHVEDNGPDEINARYFLGRSDGLQVRGFSRLMKARV